MIYKNKLSEDYKNSSLSVEQRIESVGDNLVRVNSELALHQNQLYYIKKGIVEKAMAYYQDAKPDIREKLVEAFQEMEYGFVTNDVVGFCSAVYQQLEIISNYTLFDALKLNENIVCDTIARKCSFQPNHTLNRLTGLYVWDKPSKDKKFIDLNVADDRAKYFSEFYLKTGIKDGKCELRIYFGNKLNLLYGFYIHKHETNPSDKSTAYYFYNNNFQITSKVKDIRDAKEHGLPSTPLANWAVKDYFEAFKVLSDLYQRIPELKVVV